MNTKIAILINAFMLGAMTSFIVVTFLTIFKTLNAENAKNSLDLSFPIYLSFVA